jgi:dienelactone hydrolase
MEWLFQPGEEPMIETSVEYASADRAFGGVIVLDGSVPGPRPGILVFHGGASPGTHERERSRRLAALGYAAFVPDLFGERFESREHGMSVIQGEDLNVRSPAIDRRANASGMGREWVR